MHSCRNLPHLDGRIKGTWRLRDLSPQLVQRVVRDARVNLLLFFAMSDFSFSASFAALSAMARSFVLGTGDKEKVLLPTASEESCAL